MLRSAAYTAAANVCSAILPLSCVLCFDGYAAVVADCIITS